MGKIVIWKDGHATTVSAPGKVRLQDLLIQCGLLLDHPCSGRGICKKCAVTAVGEISPPNQAEQAAGVRLSCQMEIWGDAEIWLPDSESHQVEVSGATIQVHQPTSWGVGAAIDIGTTTLAMRIYDLHNAEVLAECTAMNPQRSVSADVMGRIQAALSGEGDTLQRQIQRALHDMLQQACAQAHVTQQDLKRIVVSGNTTMLYLLTGRNPKSLSCAPFQADCLFDQWSSLWDIPVYYPPCMNAFVGADITCSVLASGMCSSQTPVLLCDIGTNGEIALWKDHTLYVTSTAAGPAFEGAGISCGCGSVPGAIDRVWIQDGQPMIHTIGEKPPVGVCGSGLIDAIAAFLKTEDLDETGAMTGPHLALGQGIALLPQDIRAVQLAKAAIAAGIRTLLKVSNTREEELTRLFIAGGFGSHLSIQSAFDIGLIPRNIGRHVDVLGNASLTGAAMLLLNPDTISTARNIAMPSHHINLGGNPDFNQAYMDEILFE